MKMVIDLKNKKSKYLKKIFYSYVALFTLLTIIVEILVCNGIVSAKNTNRAEIDTFFEQNYSLVENKVLSVFRTVELIAKNEAVKSYAEGRYDNTGYYYYSFVEINKVIETYMTAYNGYDCMLSLSRLTDNIIIDGKNTANADNYLKSKNIDKEELTAYFADGANAYNKPALWLSEGEDNRFVKYIYKYVYPSGKSMYFFIDFDKNFFLPTASVNKNEFFGIIDLKTNGVCLNSKSNNSKQSDVLEKIRTNIDEYTENDYSGKGLLAEKSLAARDMVYFYYNKGALSYFNYFTITLLLLMLWALLMLTGVYVSRLIANRLYAPVGNIFGLIADDGAGEYDDDISFLESSVANLVDNNKELRDYAEKNKEILKHGFLKDVLTGVVSPEQIKSGIEMHGIGYLEKPCLCAVCEYEKINDDSSAAGYQKMQMLKNAFAGMAEHYLMDNVSCEVVGINRSRFAIILNSSDSVGLEEVLKNLTDEAENYYAVSLVAAIGKVVDSIYQIYDSYMSAINILEYKVAFSGKQILKSEDLTQLNLMGCYYPVEVENSLINNVLEGNREKCNEIIKNIISVNYDDMSLDKQSEKDLKFLITSTVKRIMKRMNKTAEEIFGDETVIYLELNGKEGKEEFEGALRDVISKLIDSVLDDSNIKSSETTKEIIEYIDENYNRDISLQDVADRFGLSQGHIGRLLKRDMDTSFKQYLNKHRIEVAKGLLTGGENLSVGEVSSMVGCNNTMTFIRMFKRYTGVSPGDYKKTQH